MGQTYSEFKTYITTNLWRPNDTVLSNNLDVLIQQADDELEKLTRDFQKRERTVDIAPESQDFDITTEVTDFQTILSLTNNQTTINRHGGPIMRQVRPQRVYELRANNSAQPAVYPVYAIDNDSTGTVYLRLVGPFSASDPGDMTLNYRAGIPDYQSNDASWLEDEYLNLYLYTVLKHCAIFVREDERVQLYQGYQKDAFDIANMDDKHNRRFGGSPLTMQPHRRVP